MHRRTAEVVAQGAEHLAGRVPLVGHEQQEVAGRRAGAQRTSAACSASDEELGDGAVERAAVADPHPHEALGAEPPWPGR